MFKEENSIKQMVLDNFNGRMSKIWFVKYRIFFLRLSSFIE